MLNVMMVVRAVFPCQLPRFSAEAADLRMIYSSMMYTKNRPATIAKEMQ